MILTLTPLFSNEEDRLRLLSQLSLDELMNVEVSSASNTFEKASEAPAIVNTIDASMIKRYGFRNLYDALSYQPGFFIAQDSNEKVYSQRGMFTTTTQKILFKRDGSRMNNTLFNSLALDNALSMRALESIEVMRGPAGSTYGDMALTGVVSLNTLSDKSENGLVAEAGAGSYDAYSGDLTYKDINLLLWSHYYTNNGNTKLVSSDKDYATNKISANHTIDKTPDNFDIGLKYETDDYKFLATYTKNKYIAPRSSKGQLIAPEDEKAHIEQHTTDIHLLFTAKPIYKDIVFELNHYFDHFDLETPQLLNASRDGAYTSLDLDAESGSGGIDYKAKYYTDDNQFILGLKLEANHYKEIKNTKTVGTTETTYTIPSATEWHNALYAQDKYFISDDMIVNFGLRLDYYEDIGSYLSPRLAFNYFLDNRSILKLIYSRAYLSPLYFYRKSNPVLGYGASTELDPEQTDTYQLALESLFDSGLSTRATLFYTANKNTIVRSGSEYINLNRLETDGAELELKYNADDTLEWFANYSFLHVINNANAGTNTEGSEVKGYPKHMIKGGFSCLVDKEYNLYLSPSVQYISSVKNQNISRNSDYTIANINFFAKPNKNLELSLGVYNLTDEDYALGGTVNPYPQNGINLFGTIAWYFD